MLKSLDDHAPLETGAPAGRRARQRWESRKRGAIKRGARGLAAGMLSAGLMIAASQPAQAAVWNWGVPIIKVETGGKNYTARSQWVSNIYVLAPNSKARAYGCGTFEAWTQNWYQRTERCGDAFFYISRWVQSGNGVCGAWQDIDRRWPREISCITIRV